MHQKRQEAEKITNMSDTELERSMVTEIPPTPCGSEEEEHKNEAEETESTRDVIDQKRES